MIHRRHSNKTNDQIDEIIMLRTKKGMSRNQIYEYLTKEKGLGMSTAKKYLTQAEKEFQLRSVVHFADDITFDIERFEALYQQCLTDKDRKNAIKALTEICKIKGHYINKTISEDLQKTIEEIRINIKK